MKGAMIEDLKAVEAIQNKRLEKVMGDYTKSLDELAASRSEVKAAQKEVAELKKVVEVLLNENSALKHRYAAAKRWSVHFKRELDAVTFLYGESERELQKLKSVPFKPVQQELPLQMAAKN